MDKSLVASQKLMKSYLSELLTEETVQIKEENEKLNKLLENVTVTECVDETIVSKKSADNKVSEPDVKEEIEVEITPPEQLVIKAEVHTEKENTLTNDIKYRENSFQAMFFDVAGLTIAVPLIELGGIHNLTKTTNLVGKPNWFSGVMLHREEKVNVVNTALWVMPEKYNEELETSLNYQFVIMLSNSSWGLQAENLVDTVTLQPEDVKWIESGTKRPWLAGLVKDRMCALLDVNALIELLNNGINVDQI
jgi:purine-binding chemotaxis protein CheW